MNPEPDRRPICEACNHFLPEEDSCNLLRIQNKGKGRLKHQNGIANPRSSCPELRWRSIPSRHALEYAKSFPFTPELLHEITKYGIQPISILSYVNKLFLPGKMTRQEIFDRLTEISNLPNDYDE